MHRNSSSCPQQCPRQGDEAFGEELAGVAGATTTERDSPRQGVDSGFKTLGKILMLQCMQVFSNHKKKNTPKTPYLK